MSLIATVVSYERIWFKRQLMCLHFLYAESLPEYIFQFTYMLRFNYFFHPITSSVSRFTLTIHRTSASPRSFFLLTSGLKLVGKARVSRISTKSNENAQWLMESTYKEIQICIKKDCRVAFN